MTGRAAWPLLAYLRGHTAPSAAALARACGYVDPKAYEAAALRIRRLRRRGLIRLAQPPRADVRPVLVLTPAGRSALYQRELTGRGSVTTVQCPECGWLGARVDDGGPCPKCTTPVVLPRRVATTAPPQRTVERLQWHRAGAARTPVLVAVVRLPSTTEQWATQQDQDGRDRPRRGNDNVWRQG